MIFFACWGFEASELGVLRGLLRVSLPRESAANGGGGQLILSEQGTLVPYRLSFRD